MIMSSCDNGCVINDHLLQCVIEKGVLRITKSVSRTCMPLVINPKTCEYTVKPTVIWFLNSSKNNN